MDKLLYGAAYYDEYMPYDRVETDMEMMEQAGMNVIRIAESTWSTWEKREGEFDFTSLHRMLDAAKRHNISVIIGTPTYAIPCWLAAKDENILAETHSGKSLYGHRQNMDITHPLYLKYAERIIRKLLEEVKDEPHVIGYQLDNETKSYDVCSKRAQKLFVEELKERYPDINDFNREFGLDYWSNRMDDWEYFPDIRGTINGSLAAEYARFQRSLVTRFLAWQESIVKEYLRSDQFITHNFDYDWDNRNGGYGVHPEVDQFEAAEHVTVAGCDIYHPSAQDLTGAEITVLGNINRGLKRDNYFIMETEAQGNMGWLPYPGQLRLCAYSHVANGANMVEYWHWHSIHNAIESYWKGILSHDLRPNRIYNECKVVGNEWKNIGSHLVNLKKTNKIAIVADNASLTGINLFEMDTWDGHGYNRVFRWISDCLFRMNYEFDVIPAKEELLGEYDVILLPALYSAKESFLEGVRNYVQQGGNVIATFRTGFSNEHLKIYPDAQPHMLCDVFGLTYDEFTYPKNVTVSFGGQEGKASEWMELVRTDEAETLAAYNHPVWNEYAAATLNGFGRGKAMYLATMMDENVLKELIKYFLSATGPQGGGFMEPQKVKVNCEYPVVVKQGINSYGKKIVYLLNYSDENRVVSLPEQEAIELISGKSHMGGSIELKKWDLCVLEME